MSEKIHRMFTSVAPTYDLVNSVLSLGIHHWWRRATVRFSQAEPGEAVLDCATGTGDLAFAYKRAVGEEGTVVGSDFNAAMLDGAREKAQKRGVSTITWRRDDVQQLPDADDTFDLASIAFGIRNVDDPTRALESMARVVRPGGRVVILEFGQPDGFVGAFYELYSERILPAIGGLISGEPDAYTYLHESSSEFPCGDSFVEMMEETGRFSKIGSKPLTGGIAWLYRGIVA